jgi:tetratricopeptide (TPR) repeat protein
MKEFDRALEEYTRAIAAKGFWQAISYQNRAIIYAQKGQYDMAVKDMDRAIALVPNNAHFYYLRGLTYAVTKDMGKANADFDKACKMGNKNGCERLLGLMAAEKVQGAYYMTTADGVISQYTQRIIFEMKDGNLTASAPPFSVAGMTLYKTISDIAFKDNILTLTYRSQIQEIWNVTLMTADFTGNTMKIPCKWKLISGNSGSIGSESNGFLIRDERH